MAGYELEEDVIAAGGYVDCDGSSAVDGNDGAAVEYVGIVCEQWCSWVGYTDDG